MRCQLPAPVLGTRGPALGPKGRLCSKEDKNWGWGHKGEEVGLGQQTWQLGARQRQKAERRTPGMLKLGAKISKHGTHSTHHIIKGQKDLQLKTRSAKDTMKSPGKAQAGEDTGKRRQ